MSLNANRILQGRTEMIGAIRALQQYLGQPVCSSVDDQAIGQQIVKLQQYLATVRDNSQPSGFKLDPALIRSSIADHSLPGAIIQLQTVAQGALPYFSNLSTATMTRARAGYNAMLAGTRNFNLGIMGDSTDRGVDETAVPYNSQYVFSLAEFMAQQFRSTGIASGANNWYGLSGASLADYTTRDSRIVVTGSGGVDSAVVQGGAALSLTAAGSISFTPQQNCTKADIYEYDFFAGATINWQVDGGATTPIAQVGNNTIKKTTVSLGALGPHTLTLNWVSGANSIFGIDCYDDTRKEVTVRQWATSGATTQSMIDDSGSPHAGRLTQLANYPVDLVIGDLGLVNSWRSSRSIANCQADVATLMAAVQAAGGDVMFCTPPFDTGGAGATASQQAYIDAVHTTVLANGGSVFNVRTAIGSKANSDALGYTSPADAVHWRIPGQSFRAGLIVPGVKFGMGL